MQPQFISAGGKFSQLLLRFYQLCNRCWIPVQTFLATSLGKQRPSNRNKDSTDSQQHSVVNNLLIPRKLATTVLFSFSLSKIQICNLVHTALCLPKTRLKMEYDRKVQ